MKISSAELIENCEYVFDQAMIQPVTITEVGAERLVLVSVEEYARLKRRDALVAGLETDPTPGMT